MTLQRNATATSLDGAATASAPGDDVPDLGDYLAVLRRRAATIALITLAAAALGVAFAQSQPTAYEASARLLVRPLTTDPLEALGPAQRLVDIETERQIATSALVTGEVASNFDGLSARQVLENLAISASDESHVMTLTYVDQDAARAAAVPNAVARTYLDTRRSTAAEAVAASRSALEKRLVALNERLAEANEVIAAGDDAGDAATASAQSRRVVLESQIALVANDLATTSPAMLRAGEVIEAATPPTEPAGLGLLGGGIVAGLVGVVLGVAAAFIRERFDDRVRDEAEVERLTMAPVVGSVPSGRRARIGPHRDPEQGLRLLASTLTAGGTHDAEGVVAVTAPTDAPERSRTAFGLAVALAKRGPVLLVDGDPVTNTVADLAGLQDPEGLVEACEEPFGARRYVRQLREHGDLAVLPAGHGSDAIPAGAVSDVLARLGERWPTIVVDAPPVLSSEMGLLFPRVADRTLVVVRQGRTPGRLLADARLRMARARLRFDGVVMLGPVKVRTRRTLPTRASSRTERLRSHVVARHS